ncbi:MAG: hypothetical protein ACI4E1_00600 [Lachnospira sp.]
MKTVPVNSNDCKRIFKTIQKCIDDGFSSFIIYPRGMVSSYVQEIVSKLGGRVEII